MRHKSPRQFSPHLDTLPRPCLAPIPSPPSLTHFAPSNTRLQSPSGRLRRLPLAGPIVSPWPTPSSPPGRPRQVRVEFSPLGVIGAIVPWNYPFHNVFNPVSAALFSGNAIVIKVHPAPHITHPYNSPI